MASSAKRALKVLEVVAKSERPLGVTEIARRLALPPGTVFRTLDALQRSAYAERYQASSRYVVGAAAVQLRQGLFAQYKIRSLALPYLRQLASATGETASLIVPLGWYGLRVASARGSNEITNAAPLGSVGALTDHYAGRLILALMPDRAAERYCAWEQARGAGRPARSALDLSAMRERGVALEAAGFSRGKGAIALPIRSRSEAIGAIALEGPVIDVADPKPGKTVIAAVKEIEKAVTAHPEKFRNPFAHMDPAAIVLDD